MEKWGEDWGEVNQKNDDDFRSFFLSIDDDWWEVTQKKDDLRSFFFTFDEVRGEVNQKKMILEVFF